MSKVSNYRGWGAGGGRGRRMKPRGGSCHKSQRFKINNHKSQTFQMPQSQSQRMAQRILKLQVTDKLFCRFKDHRVFYLAITEHRQYLCHKSQTYFQPFHKSQTLKQPNHKSQKYLLPSPTPHPQNILVDNQTRIKITDLFCTQIIHSIGIQPCWQIRIYFFWECTWFFNITLNNTVVSSFNFKTKN